MANEVVKGLSCPRCGGMIDIPEGQPIVVCPFCDLRSIVSGKHGTRRFQVENQVTREQVESTWQAFLRSSMAIARAARSQAKLKESFLVYLPFWNVTGKGLGWGFGKKRVGSGDNRRYVPKEVRVVEELHWNLAACDVGEFGVNRVEINGRPITPFDPEDLHHQGLVFEPVGSADEALHAAETAFENQVRRKASLDRQEQLFVRIVRPLLTMVYYPLWIVRYTYRGRSFQVVVDGFSGEVLYGKAPGSVAYRAAALVLGMAIGSFLAIDAPTLVINFSDEVEFMVLVILFGGGLALMYGAWRVFRFGEHYEFQKYRVSFGPADLEIGLPREARELLDIVNKMGVFK